MAKFQNVNHNNIGTIRLHSDGTIKCEISEDELLALKGIRTESGDWITIQGVIEKKVSAVRAIEIMEKIQIEATLVVEILERTKVNTDAPSLVDPEYIYPQTKNDLRALLGHPTREGYWYHPLPELQISATLSADTARDFIHLVNSHAGIFCRMKDVIDEHEEEKMKLLHQARYRCLIYLEK